MCASSLDDLVCSRQQRFRDGEAEGFGGFEVDDQIKFRDLLYRQVGGFLAFQDAPGVDANLAVDIAEAAAIAHQTTGQSKFTICEQRGQRVRGRNRRNLFRAPVEEDTVGDDRRTNTLL